MSNLTDDQVIQKLGDRKWRTREAAQAEIVKRGDKAIAALRKATGQGDAETNKRVRNAIDTICWKNYRVLIKALEGSFQWAYNLENPDKHKELIKKVELKFKQSQCDIKAIVDYIDVDLPKEIDKLPYKPEQNRLAKNHVLFVFSYFDQDLDKDGIMDQWEIKNGLDPTNKEDANEDPDGDGKSNKQEYQKNTNPYQKD
ncbi:hypothetical protein [Aquimarina sp. 2201CG5-10]|uniref:hypothetical protein n=1 Tax=Aquimarina callyspongiae TaxID=3098150 RepID=UPI002AB44AE6|nr:hypothetical protein [Aquimarina sp. 2201CG5-10]MDY8135557.1 hypothetical protein [Aquimarina sp. 2201CG5-10]